MLTSRICKPPPFLPLTFGRRVGHAKTSATQTRTDKGSAAHEAGCSTNLWTLLVKFNLGGLSWKTLSGSSAPKTEPRLRQLSTSLKKSGIWAGGSRATRSTLVFPTAENVFSLSQVIDPRPPYSSLLTAANATGILRREKRAGRALDPIFERALQGTVRFWSSVAAALGIPKQRAFAPRFAPKLADIKAVTAIGPLSAARNLTWDECEKLMGFPEGWTAVEGDSLATPSRRQSRNGSGSKSSELKKNSRKQKRS